MHPNTRFTLGNGRCYKTSYCIVRNTYRPVTNCDTQYDPRDNNTIVLRNLCEYCHKWYIVKKQDSLGYISVEDSIGLSSTPLT